MTPQTNDLEAVLRRARIKPATIQPKPRTAGPKPVPELDPHVRASYESGEAYELTVPAWAVKDTKTMIRKSARFVGHELGKDIRVTLQEEPKSDGSVIVRFRARDVLNQGRRASQARQAPAPRRGRK